MRRARSQFNCHTVGSPAAWCVEDGDGGAGVAESRQTAHSIGRDYVTSRSHLLLRLARQLGRP
eukprot:1039616-Rhodomonas_salina.6